MMKRRQQVFHQLGGFSQQGAVSSILGKEVLLKVFSAEWTGKKNVTSSNKYVKSIHTTCNYSAFNRSDFDSHLFSFARGLPEGQEEDAGGS